MEIQIKLRRYTTTQIYTMNIHLENYGTQNLVRLFDKNNKDIDLILHRKELLQALAILDEE